MTKNLRRIKQESTLWHYCNGVRMDGPPPNLRGDVTDLRGDVSGLWGDVTDLWGDVTGLRGDIDTAGLTQEERANGVDVRLLVK